MSLNHRVNRRVSVWALISYLISLELHDTLKELSRPLPKRISATASSLYY